MISCIVYKALIYIIDAINCRSFSIIIESRIFYV